MQELAPVISTGQCAVLMSRMIGRLHFAHRRVPPEMKEEEEEEEEWTQVI